MSPPAAAVVSDLPPHPPHRFDELASRLNPEMRDRIASVVSTLKARMAAPLPGAAQPPPTTAETNGLAMHTPAPSPTSAPVPVPAPALPLPSLPLPRPSPAAANAPASASAIKGSSPPGSAATPNALRLQLHRVSSNLSSAAPPRLLSQAPSPPGSAMSPQTPALVVPSSASLVTGLGAGQQPGPSGAFNSPTFASQSQGQGQGQSQAQSRSQSQSQSPIVETSHQYTDLTEAIQKTNPSVVRQVVRDQWHKCLVGSDYHCSFIANATFHQASTSTLRRAIQDFGQGMVKASKHQIVKHLNADDLDEVATALLPKLSNKFLDQVLARRLETIGAQDLLNALARAERLGYDVHDVVERKPGVGIEHVIPSMQPAAIQLPVPSQNDQARPMPQHQASGTQHNPPAKWAPYIPGTEAPAGTPQTPLIATPNAKSNAGPLGVPKTLVNCHYCRRPCTSVTSLNYHIKKAKCQAKQGYETTGKEVCVHCGCRFTGIGGLVYHSKGDVCGIYTEHIEQQMIALLGATVSNLNVPLQTSTPAPPPSSAVSHKTPGQLAAAVSTPGSVARQAVATPTSSITPDPYAKLTAEERVRFEVEIRQGEEHYGRLMKDALLLPDTQREAELAKLKNRYNTRQSMTRKKYGIRLRERRSVAEIEAERSRLFGSSAADGDGHAAKKARTSIEGQGRVTQSSVPPRMESPRKRVPMVEMGGLSGSSATAELVDPTALLTPSQPRHLAAPQAPQATPPMARRASQGTSNDPMQLDDTSDDSSDTDSDDEDIPAKIAVA